MLGERLVSLVYTHAYCFMLVCSEKSFGGASSVNAKRLALRVFERSRRMKPPTPQLMTKK